MLSFVAAGGVSVAFAFAINSLNLATLVACSPASGSLHITPGGGGLNPGGAAGEPSAFLNISYGFGFAGATGAPSLSALAASEFAAIVVFGPTLGYWPAPMAASGLSPAP